jgi:hypothetical protein
MYIFHVEVNHWSILTERNETIVSITSEVGLRYFWLRALIVMYSDSYCVVFKNYCSRKKFSYSVH